MEWILVNDIKKKPIGAIGFKDRTAFVIVSFYDSNDANKDGKVSLAERFTPFTLKKKGITEVAMYAKHNTEILMRDPSFAQAANNLFINFAVNVTRDAVYRHYFQPGVRMVGGNLAQIITTNQIKQMVIKKGFEKLADRVFTSLAY